MTAPRPGDPVRGSRSGRPVMALLDLLGRRLTLRVLWELRAGEAVTFRELQQRCDGASASTLNQRLADLTAVGLLDRQDGYRLTLQARDLIAALAPLEGWAAEWAAGLEVGRGDRD